METELLGNYSVRDLKKQVKHMLKKNKVTEIKVAPGMSK